MEILTSTSALNLEMEATAGLQFVSVAVLKLAAVSEDVKNVQLKYGPTCPTIFDITCINFCKFLSCDDSRFCLLRGPANSLVFCLLRDDFLLTPSEGHYQEVSKSNEKLLEEHLGEAPGQLDHEARNR